MLVGIGPAAASALALKSDTGGKTGLFGPPYSVLPANEPRLILNSSKSVPVPSVHKLRGLLWPNRFDAKPELTWSRFVD